MKKEMAIEKYEAIYRVNLEWYFNKLRSLLTKLKKKNIQQIIQ